VTKQWKTAVTKQSQWRTNGLTSQMLFSEIYKIIHSD